jgi:hypothetical protein
MSKMHLIFDTTDAATILASDSVGAYVRSSDGTLITATGTALDVNIDNASIVVTATDLDIRDLTAVSDSVESWTHDGTGNAITSTAGALDVNLKSPLVVDVSLSHTNDSVHLGDGTNLLTSTTVGPDIGLDVNLINASIVVTATDLDIRDLTAASDSVESWLNDGAGNAITSTGGALDVNITNSITVNDAALANIAIATAANAMSVANTAEDVVASPLANRKYLHIYNNGNLSAYIGASGVTSANGYPLSPGAEMILRAGAAIDIEWVAANVQQNIRTLELS